MAFHVERKSKWGVDYFAAKLHDPNDTGTFGRVVQREPDGLVPRRSEFERLKLGLAGVLDGS